MPFLTTGGMQEKEGICLIFVRAFLRSKNLKSVRRIGQQGRRESEVEVLEDIPQAKLLIKSMVWHVDRGLPGSAQETVLTGEMASELLERGTIFKPKALYSLA